MDPYNLNQNYNNGPSSKLAGLNGLPSDYEMALQQQRANGFDNRGAYDFQADLDMFTNTQFFDFDMAEVPENNTSNVSDGDMWGMNNGFMAGKPSYCITVGLSESQPMMTSTPLNRTLHNTPAYQC